MKRRRWVLVLGVLLVLLAPLVGLAPSLVHWLRTPPLGMLTLTMTAHPDQTYYLYVPSSYRGDREFRLLVSVHGAHRTAPAYAERFVTFADQHDYIVLAPLFPDDVEYQTLGIGGAYRADLRLLELIDEVAARYHVETEQFDLFGFSGGGQFSHRFLYVHPERVRSVAIGAPGTITVPTDEYPWPDGAADLERVAGATLDLGAIRERRVMLIVGQDDTGPRVPTPL